MRLNPVLLLYDLNIPNLYLNKPLKFEDWSIFLFYKVFTNTNIYKYFIKTYIIKPIHSFLRSDSNNKYNNMTTAFILNLQCPNPDEKV